MKRALHLFILLSLLTSPLWAQRFPPDVLPIPHLEPEETPLPEGVDEPKGPITVDTVEEPAVSTPTSPQEEVSGESTPLKGFEAPEDFNASNPSPPEGVSIPLPKKTAPSTFEMKKVAKIDVIAQELPPEITFDTKAVLARLKTKVGEKFSQTDFDNDLKTLVDEYDRVEPSIEVINDELYITLKIWPRPLIKEIVWKGNEKLSKSTLQETLDIKAGSFYNRQKFLEAFHKIKAYYIKKGFFESELDYKVIPIPQTGEVTIEIDIHEGRKGHIDDIIFEGFSDKDENAICDLINTKTYFVFTSWLTDAGTFHPETVERDKLIILNYLQNEGYADAKVEIKVEEAKSNNYIVLRIVADKGELYTVGTVTFKGNTIFSNEVIEKLFRIFPKSAYSPDKLRETAHSISDHYGEKGYIDCVVSYESTLIPETRQYNIDYTIKEGSPYKVGLIKVFGNLHTMTPVILHESLLVPGEVFDIRKLKATEERLMQTEYFKHVNVYAVRSNEKSILGPGYRDVYIEVEEQGTGHFSLFFGFSTLDSIFGGAEIVERNFNYKGFSNLSEEGIQALRGGGEYAKLKMTVGRKFSSLETGWTKPYFLDTPWIVGFDIFQTTNERQSQDYDLKTVGFNVHASYPFNAFLRTRWHYRLSYNNLSINTDNPTTVTQLQQQNNNGILSASGLSLSYDSTDNAMKARKGFRSELYAEYAGLGGKFHFLSMGYNNSYYFPVTKSSVFRIRADVDFIDYFRSDTNVPVSDRLMMGGETTVRGYESYSIGPTFDGSVNGVPSGGFSSLLLSEEYLYTLTKAVDVFAFCDAGSCSQLKYHLSRLQIAVGFGLRVTAFGRFPLIVGMGFPTNAASKSQVRRFFFSIGGRF